LTKALGLFLVKIFTSLLDQAANRVFRGLRHKGPRQGQYPAQSGKQQIEQ